MSVSVLFEAAHAHADADQVQGFYFGEPVPAAAIGSNILNEVRQSAAAARAAARLRPVQSTAAG